MQDYNFIRLSDQVTRKDFIVAPDLITYIVENTNTLEDNTCQVHYATPQSEIDYVIDTIEEIQSVLSDIGEDTILIQLLDGRLALINLRYLLRIHLEGDGITEPEVTIITLRNGVSFAVQDNIDNILRSGEDLFDND